MTKYLRLLLLLNSIYFQASGQVSIKEFRKLRQDSISRYDDLFFLGVAPMTQNINSTDKLISNDAFRKLVKKDIAFAILGSQSATPGFSVDLSNKLSIKLSGLLPTKRKIVNIDFEASKSEDMVFPRKSGRLKKSRFINLNHHYNDYQENVFSGV